MTGPRELFPDVRTIAVLRPNAVGDFVLALPMLHALRLAYPDAKILYIGRQWHADFLKDRPGPVDEVAVIPPCPGVGAPVDTDPARALAFADELRESGIDLALQVYGGGRYSNPFIKRLGARLCVGLKAAEAEPLDRWIAYTALANRRLQLLEVAGLVGATCLRLGRELEVTDQDHAEAVRHLPPGDTRPLVLLHPVSTDPRRCWPAERFAAVGDMLASAGALVAINGMAEERPVVHAVLERMRHPALDLSGKLSLSGLCGMLDRAALLVSNDSGPLHLALAIGTPSVGIYWLSNLFESGPLMQATHRAALSVRVHCPVCGVENIAVRCPHDVSFVDDVSLDTVAGMAKELYFGARERMRQAQGEA